ncbi:MAG: hypothetical protein WC714_29360 [Candidatus Obscuribacterales bacterium]|jgi:hypothetical protein
MSNKAPRGDNLSYLGLGSFATMVKQLRSRLLQPASVPNPFLNLASSGDGGFEIFKSTAQDGLSLLPSRYHAAYVNVLVKAVEQAESIVKNSSLRNILKRKHVLSQLEEAFKVLAAPIVQLRSGKHETELKAYLALASNLYQRFISDEKIRELNQNSGSWPELDPLGFFVDEPGSGPYTVVPSREMPLSLICKPASQMFCLPLWVLDGHEVGGHGIHSILNGFAAEMADALESAVAKAFAAKKLSLPGPNNKVSKRVHHLVLPGTRKRDLSAEEFARHLARTFSLEFAADMAGVLNFGPMFANGLMLYFSAEHKDSLLSYGGTLSGKGSYDAHPSDVIRAMAAIEAVRQLKIADGDRYVADLTSRLNLASSHGSAFSFTTSDGSEVVSLPHAFIQALVPVLVDAALNTSLPCLAERSLKEVLTWTDSDESVVKKLVATIASTKFDSEEAEARHIVAASLQALELQSASNTLTSNDLAKITARIQANGIKELKALYSEQCLLCAVPTYARSRRTESSLTDLIQRIRLSIKDARGE